MGFLEKGHVGGDVFIREASDPTFTRESKEVENSGDEVVQLLAGYPMDDDTPVTASDEANTDGLVLETVSIAPGDTVKVAVVTRGHVVVNRDAMPTHDIDGDPLNLATIQTALEALGFVVRREPPTQGEHET